MNIFLMSTGLSWMAGQVRNAWSLLSILYESASGRKLEGIQCSPESWLV